LIISYFSEVLSYLNPSPWPLPNTPTTQYTSEEFVESSGAILFDLSHETKSVCLIHYTVKDEWLLAKGRRNCGESRLEAALREVEEETGYKCHVYSVTM
jgi:8-oxo-dGTP pyrophosphatase MutT (NUDIX family)